MLKPMGRNTAPVIAMAAFCGLETDPNLLILPSDHLFKDVAAFWTAIEKAAELPAQGRLVTFGIKPDTYHTGYGYVKHGQSIDDLGFVVEQFVDKPDITIATTYLRSGDYFWNSGVNVFEASVYLEILKKRAPEILASCEKAAENLTIDLDFVPIAVEPFRERGTMRRWSGLMRDGTISAAMNLCERAWPRMLRPILRGLMF